MQGKKPHLVGQIENTIGYLETNGEWVMMMMKASGGGRGGGLC